MRAIIIDDESDCVKLLALQLKMSCPEVTVIAECNSGEDGLRAIRELKPQLLFLDIEMPRMNGFQLLEALGEIDFPVVFTTAYDRFAVRAFQFSALDYLLKPVDTKELQRAVNKAARALRTDIRQIELLQQHLRSPESAPRRIALPYQNGLTFVELSSILYCEADNNYTRFIVASGEKYVVSKTLREVQEAIEGRNFVRIHRQYLVNTDHIRKYVRGEGNYIIMSDDKSIPVSKSHKDELIKRFGWL
jgi:two-component system, LytTR family, response regulator